MKAILKQKISNHPNHDYVERFVVIHNVAIQGEFDQILIDASVEYFNTKLGREDKSFNGKLDNWIVNNNDFTTVRDAKGNPVPNPQFREVPTEGEDDRSPAEREPYLRLPSFDYFFGIITDPKAPSLIALLSLHIAGNDQIKFFDEMLNIPV